MWTAGRARRSEATPAARGPDRGCGRGRARRPAGGRPLAGRGAPWCRHRASGLRLAAAQRPRSCGRAAAPSAGLLPDPGRGHRSTPTEFEQLVGAGRAAAAAGDHARALTDLDAALALWRGEALAEFADDEFAIATVARLTELRTGALEDRALTLLELGRAAEALPGLEALVARHPSRERPAVALMRALYAVGRQADALAAYHDLRARLDDELGVEPADEAQALYRRILVHDPALSTAPPKGNLPRRATGFVGRGQEIERVGRRAPGRAPLVTLTGVGGVGKSRLALEVARPATGRGSPTACGSASSRRLPDGSPVGHAVAAALRVQQRHGLSIEQTVIEYLRGRGAAARPGQLRARPRRRRPAGRPDRRALPRRDGAGDQSGSARGRRRAACGRCRRCPSTTPPRCSCIGRGPCRPTSGLDREPAGAVAEICRRLDGLPLAIELAAARMRVMSPVEVARRLDGAPLLGGGRGPRRRGTRASPRRSTGPTGCCRARTAAVRRACRSSRVVPTCAAVHGVCGEPGAAEDDTLDLLTRLVDKSLVVARAAAVHSRYRLLETLRAYGRDRVEAAGADRALAHRHATYFVELAERAARGHAGPGRAGLGGRALPDYDNLRAAFELGMADRDADLALRLVTSLPEFVHLRIGYEAVGLGRAGTGRRRSRASALRRRGRCRRAGRMEPRRLHARPAAGSPGRRARPPAATARSPIPATSSPTWPCTRATSIGAAALHRRGAAARASDDPIRLVWTLYYVAICQAAAAHPERGVGPRAEESLAVADATANPTARSMARYALGLVLKKSEPDRALALFDEAAELAAAVRNFWWQGIALMEAAATRAVHGDPVAAAAPSASCSTTGTGSATDPAVAQPALHRPAASAARRRVRRRRPARLPGRRGQALPVRPAGRATRASVGRAGRGAGGLRPRLPRTACLGRR